MVEVTRFQEFLDTWHINYTELARVSGYSRQHIRRIRKGLNRPSRRCIAALVGACRKLTGEKVETFDLFGDAAHRRKVRRRSRRRPSTTTSQWDQKGQRRSNAT
jgi:hypothetical protein